MEAKLLKIESLSDKFTISAGGKDMAKRTAVMKELDRYGNAYVATLLGEDAEKPLMVGDVTATVLKFSVREFEGRSYQDTLVLAVVKLGNSVQF